MRRTDFLIEIVAFAAQSVRDASGVRLMDAWIQPFAMLQQFENMLACAHMAYGAYQLRCLRESLEIESLALAAQSKRAGHAGGFAAGLVLYDVCQALELGENETQRAISLADWSDVMRALGADIEVMPRGVAHADGPWEGHLAEGCLAADTRAQEGTTMSP